MPRVVSHLFALRNDSNAGAAKSLRSNLTDAERLLWYYLRAGRFQGFKFRRQVPLGDYVVDFLCEKARLIIEVDGGRHAEQVAEDEARTRWLDAQGYRGMRFWNNDVLENLGGVLEMVAATLR